MTRKSDLSPEASSMARAQAQRLRRLRRLITAYQADTAEAAGVSQDAWSRMELGQARIDAVALGRFALEFQVPAEYVVTGRAAGLADDLLRRILAAEAAEARPAPPRGPAGAASEDSAAHRASAPGRSRRRAGSRGRPAKAQGSLV